MESKNFLTKMKRFFSPQNKKRLFFGLFLLLVLFVFKSQACLAQDVGTMVQQGIAWAFYKLAQVAGLILGLSMWFVGLMSSSNFYEAVLFSPEAKSAINLGWVVVRDFLNLFFILMLLLIAIGTILRVPAYGDKKMVFNVVLAALLINFSKPIALVFIDVSQLAMNFFMSALAFGDSETFATKILQNIQIEKVLTTSGEMTDANNGYLSPIFMSMAAIIFFLVMAVMLFVLAATLLVRVISFWVLIILSPMAMFGLAMPRSGLSVMKGDWFQKMLHWSFFGPIQMFFLWLATLIMVRLTSYPVLTEGINLKLDSAGLLTKIFEIIIPYVSAIYLLFYGYDMSKKFSTGAATSVMNYGSQKMNQYGKKWGKMAAIGGAGAMVVGAGGLMGAAAVGATAGGYFGGRAFGKRAKETINATREKWGGVLGTEEQKKRKREEEKEERVARIKGGEEEKRYWRGRTNKQKKEWEDAGIDDKTLEGKMKKGNPAEKKAAAMLLAERGKIADKNKFKEAINALGGDKVLEGKLRKSVKEEHAFASIEYDNEEAWKNLGQVTVSEDAIKKAVAENDTMKKIAQNARIGLDDGPALLAHFKALKSGAQADFEKQAYFGQMNNMSTAELFKQKDFFNHAKVNPTVRDYLQANTGTTAAGVNNGRGFTKNNLKKEAAKMNDARTQAAAMGIIP